MPLAVKFTYSIHLHAMRFLVLVFHHDIKSCLALKELLLQQHPNDA